MKQLPNVSYAYTAESEGEETPQLVCVRIGGLIETFEADSFVEGEWGQLILLDGRRTVATFPRDDWNGAWYANAVKREVKA